MLVRRRSVHSVLAIATDDEDLTALCHRVAAAEDSRVLPLVGIPVPG